MNAFSLKIFQCYSISNDSFAVPQFVRSKVASSSHELTNWIITKPVCLHWTAIVEFLVLVTARNGLINRSNSSLLSRKPKGFQHLMAQLNCRKTMTNFQRLASIKTFTFVFRLFWALLAVSWLDQWRLSAALRRAPYTSSGLIKFAELR